MKLTNVINGKESNRFLRRFEKSKNKDSFLARNSYSKCHWEASYEDAYFLIYESEKYKLLWFPYGEMSVLIVRK